MLLWNILISLSKYYVIKNLLTNHFIVRRFLIVSPRFGFRIVGNVNTVKSTIFCDGVRGRKWKYYDCCEWLVDCRISRTRNSDYRLFRASKLLSFSTGLWVSIFIGLPWTEKVYARMTRNREGY